MCFLAGLNATGPLAAPDALASSFNISLADFDYSYYIVTSWNIGAAIIPLFILPLMEDFGIRRIYLGCYVVFMVFVGVQAASRSFAVMIVGRVVAGASGGVLQNCVDGIIADLYGGDVEGRAVALTVYIFALLGGVTAGPVIGAGVVRYLDWRW